MLPDPRVLNPDVPLGLVAVLWSLTAADPAACPPSAAAALQLIGRVRSELAVGVLLGAADEHARMENLMRLSALALSAAGLTLALTLTWAGHLLTSMTPLLFFEYTWPWPQVLAAALVVALPAAILGNWGALEIAPGEF